MKNKIIVLSFTLIILVSCTLDEHLFNQKEIEEYQLPDNVIPSNLIEEVVLDSRGNKIYGFWVSSNGGRSGITILYCHGNKHNIDEYWDRVMLLHDLGVNVFIFDYRGYGKSEGEPSEEGLFEDSETALNYVISRPEVYTDSLCFYGYSLGNVASIYLAAEIQDPLCLFSEAPFASANSLIQGSLVLDIQPLWLTAEEFDNVKKIKKINTHFLLMHGDNDDFVRFRDNGKLVFNAAPEPKELLLVKNAVHNNLPYAMGKENYLNKLNEWISISMGM